MWWSIYFFLHHRITVIILQIVLGRTKFAAWGSTFLGRFDEFEVRFWKKIGGSSRFEVRPLGSTNLSSPPPPFWTPCIVILFTHIKPTQVTRYFFKNRQIPCREICQKTKNYFSNFRVLWDEKIERINSFHKYYFVSSKSRVTAAYLVFWNFF